MAEQSMIKEFLVGLGFKTDEKSLKTFTQGIEHATKSVVKLVSAIEVAALAVGASVSAFAANMESLYFASQRVGASATNIKATENAVKNLGGSAEGARSAIEGIARFMRDNPGGESWIKSLGVETRDAKGNLRDTSDILIDLGKKMSQMPWYQAKQYGQVLGIDDNTLRAITSGQFADEIERQRKLLKDAGFEGATEKAHAFMVKLRELETRIQSIGVTIGSALLDALGPQMEEAAKWFEQNADQIAAAVSMVGKTIVTVAGFIGPILKTIADGWKNIYEWVSAAGRKINEILPTSASDKIGAGTAWLFDKLGIRDQVDKALGLAPSGNPASGQKQAQPGQQGAQGQQTSAQQGQQQAAAAPAMAPKYADAAARMAALEKQYGLPAGLLDSVWQTESGRGKNMRSSVGAQGHFQFMPDTAKQYGLANPDDFNQSSDAAARYYRDLLKKYGGNLEQALAAYNWGPGNVDKKGLANAPLETRNYMNRVMGGMGQSASVQVSQKTDIHVTGGSDPAATGRAVASEQSRVNENLSRNFRTAVQ